MSANLGHTFEAGQVSGTVITTPNSAVGGNQFDTVTGSPTYTSTAYRGSSAAAFTTTASATQVSLNWTTSIGTALAMVYGRAILKPTALTGVTPFCRCRAAGTQSFRVVIGTDGKISLRNTASTILVTSANAMTTSSTWLIRWAVPVGSSSTGVLYIHTDPTSGTPTETLTASASNFGTGNIDEANYGVGAATSSAGLILDDIMFTSLGLPGPPLQSITVADTITITDGAIRALALARADAETLAITDAMQRSLAVARTAATTTTITDSTTRAVALARAQSESMTLTDVALRGVVLTRTQPETIQITDGSARVASQGRTAVDTTTITDTAVRALAASRIAATATTITDGTLRSISNARPAAGTIDLADGASRSASYGRTQAETIGITDDAAHASSTARAVGDTTTILDAAIRALLTSRTVAETIEIDDFAAANSALARALADAITITDFADGVFVPGGAHAPGRGTPTTTRRASTALLDRPNAALRSRIGANLL